MNYTFKEKKREASGERPRLLEHDEIPIWLCDCRATAKSIPHARSEQLAREIMAIETRTMEELFTDGTPDHYLCYVKDWTRIPNGPAKTRNLALLSLHYLDMMSSIIVMMNGNFGR